MKRMFIALLAGALSGCAAMPRVQPIGADAPASSAFGRAYSDGKQHLAAGRIGLALVAFQRALAMDPHSVAALNAAGAAYDELHRPELAAQYYAAALVIEPNSADTLNNVAISAALAGDKARASEFLKRAAALAPANAVILANAALLAPAVLVAQSEPDPGQPLLERTGLSEFSLTTAEQ